MKNTAMIIISAFLMFAFGLFLDVNIASAKEDVSKNTVQISQHDGTLTLNGEVLKNVSCTISEKNAVTCQSAASVSVPLHGIEFSQLNQGEIEELIEEQCQSASANQGFGFIEEDGEDTYNMLGPGGNPRCQAYAFCMANIRAGCTWYCWWQDDFDYDACMNGKDVEIPGYIPGIGGETMRYPGCVEQMAPKCDWLLGN